MSLFVSKQFNIWPEVIAERSFFLYLFVIVCEFINGTVLDIAIRKSELKQPVYLTKGGSP